MDKKQIKQKVAELLNEGKPKNEVFQTLSGGTVKDNQLAIFIASHANPRLYELHDKKINTLITIMFIQALLAALLGGLIGAKIGPVATWVVAALCALIPLLFAFGFYKNHAGTYNAYIVLSLIQTPKLFSGFSTSPTASIIGAAIGLGILAYVWYVRSLLFPDFTFLSPKKSQGKYVFAS